MSRPFQYKQLQRHKLISTIRRPSLDERHPVCHLCGKVVDFEEIVENRPGVGRHIVTIRVKHHGSEERQEFDMGTVEWSEEDFTRVICRYRWFAPETTTASDYKDLGNDIYVDDRG